VYDLNELELIRGRIYANIWHSDSIAVIEPATGEVVAWLDLSGILAGPSPGVLNGIAFDPDSVLLFVTGKNWPSLFEIWVDPLDYAPEIVAVDPPSPVCAYIDSPLALSICADDLDTTDSLEYTWSVNGVVDPSAAGSSYTYTGSASTVDTVVVEVTDGIFGDSTSWVIYVEVAGVEPEGGTHADRDNLIFLAIYPNPVRGSAAIDFTFGAGAEAGLPVSLTIHDVSGRRVATILDSNISSGSHRCIWSGRDDGGRRVSSGLFFCRLRVGEKLLTRKIAVLERGR
jgi:hypothetical protein